MERRLHSMSEQEAQDKRQQLEKFIRNSAIFEIEPSLDRVRETLFASRPGSIYYGTGVCTPKEISIGLPFDALGMVLAAERVRQLLGFDGIYHHVADTHAKSNRLFDEAEVDRIAHRDSRESKKNSSKSFT